MQLKRALLALLFFTGQALAHGALQLQIQELTTTMRQQGKSAPLLIKRGRLELEHGDNRSATRDFLSALKINPQERSAYYYLAEQAFAQNNLADAGRHAKTFLSMLNGEAGAVVRGHSLYGQILLAQGQYDAAESSFRIAVDQAAEPSPERYLHLAQAQSKAGATERALASLDEGMQKLGMLTVLQNTSIGLNIELKAWDAALERLDALIMQGQGSPELYLRKAKVLLAAKRQSAAQEAVQQGLTSIDQIPAARRETPAMKQLRDELVALQSQG